MSRPSCSPRVGPRRNTKTSAAPRRARALGVGDHRIYIDQGLTGTNRDRPGLELALAACRAGDTFVVTKLDWLGQSLPDARDSPAQLIAKNVRLSMGGSQWKVGLFVRPYLAAVRDRGGYSDGGVDAGELGAES